MTLTLPKPQLILGYRDLFKEEPPNDRLMLLHGMDKETVLAEILRLNYTFRPWERMYQDTSFSTQSRELLYMCGENKELYNLYATRLTPFTKMQDDYSLLFTRQTCLFAAEEIIQSNLAHVPGFTMKDSWDALLRYLFAVNSTITDIRMEDEKKGDTLPGTSPLVDEPSETIMTSISPFEDINKRTFTLNELSLDTNSVTLINRGLKLLEYLTRSSDIGVITTSYLFEMYGMEYDHFIYELASMHFSNNQKKTNNMVRESGSGEIDMTFMYFPAPDSESLFEAFSKIFPSTSPIKLQSIRKYPFYKGSKGYMVTDNIFLLEKGYTQFINDFWFDKVRHIKGPDGGVEFPVRRYRGIIGDFIESYVGEMIEYAFSEAKHFKVKKFDELMVVEKGKQVELLDLYIREKNQIFLAEVKSTNIYDDARYGESLGSFYKHDRNQFFKSFGIHQLVHALELLVRHAHIFDPGFPPKGGIKVYPTIVVNEKGLQTPLMAQVFNTYFKTVLPASLDQRLKIQPLIIMHVSDWENIEDHLHKCPKDFFKLLKYHVRSPNFMPPFYNTIRLKEINRKPYKAIQQLGELVKKYQRSDSSGYAEG